MNVPHARTTAPAAPVVTPELLERYDRPGPRYTSYPTAVQFDDSVDAYEYRLALEEASASASPLSLYTHLPFCEHRCLYCACNVVITRRRDVADPYLERVVREIALVAERLGGRRRVSQFHLGGGTPTYYAPEQLTALMGHYRDQFEIGPDAEVAVEVDPRVTTTDHLQALAAAGFNRMSLGVQDFDPRVQEAVRRVQSVEETRELMDAGRALGFRSLNVDLIYGLPHQSEASFARTIDRVVELRPDRLAVYSFALVPWLKHHQTALPHEALPKGRDKFALLSVARERLLAAGYRDIGMDHFALPDDDLARALDEGRLWRNFMGYTTNRADDLIGFGLSAIGSLAGRYVQNVKKLNRYYEAIDAGRLPVERGLVMDLDDRVRQEVIASWMCTFRIDKEAIRTRYGIDFDAYFRREIEALRPLADEGFVILGDHAIDAAGLGRLFPRNVAMVFDRYLKEAPAGGPRFSRTV